MKENNPMSSSIFMIEKQNKTSYLFLKRVQDIVFSLTALLLLLPLFVLISLMIVLNDPSASPLYKQVRIGQGGKPFVMYKFRTMIKGAEQMKDQISDQNERHGPVFKMKRDPRIIRVGYFLRSTYLDELPQLWNVLLGDMSLVGPRLALPAEVEQYTAYQRNRLLVTPGLTCFWQVYPDQNALSFDEWVAMDLEYIEQRGLLLDWMLILKTIKVMVFARGE